MCRGGQQDVERADVRTCVLVEGDEKRQPERLRGQSVNAERRFFPGHQGNELQKGAALAFPRQKPSLTGIVHALTRQKAETMPLGGRVERIDALPERAFDFGVGF